MNNKELILKEIKNRVTGLAVRINSGLDPYVRTELINRCEALESLYFWIEENIVEQLDHTNEY